MTPPEVPCPAAPAALPALGAAAQLKSEPEDFVVVETLPFVPAGDGEHVYLKIRKRGLTTGHAASLIAGAAGVPRSDVSYAGMKDRMAVATQWFSVRQPRPGFDLHIAGLTELDRTRHTSKLRPGQVAGNQFSVRLRHFSGDRDRVESRLLALGQSGFPNYFGPQRFGWDNWPSALAWLALPRGQRSRVPRDRKSQYMSTLRSGVFNAVLARRVTDGTWRRLLDGDVSCAGVPTGPLWGRGRSATTGSAMAVERAVLAAYGAVLEQLEFLGLKQDRRRFAVTPRDLVSGFEGDSLNVSFSLPAGAYAVVMLNELATLEQRSGSEEGARGL